MVSRRAQHRTGDRRTQMNTDTVLTNKQHLSRGTPAGNPTTTNSTATATAAARAPEHWRRTTTASEPVRSKTRARSRPRVAAIFAQSRAAPPSRSDLCGNQPVSQVACFRPKLGHDLREIHSTDWSEPHLAPTTREPRLKGA